MAATATLLIGALAFLYFETERADPGRQTEITSLLRRLRDVDQQWDREVLRRQSAERASPLFGRPIADIERIRNALESELRERGDETLVERFAPVKASLTEKAELVGRYHAASVAADQALAAALEVLRSKQVDQAVAGRFTSILTAFDAAPTDSAEQEVQAQIVELEQSSAGLPAAPRAAFAASIRAYLAHRTAEAAAAHGLARVTAGARLDAFSDTVERRFAAAAQKKDLYRVYLVYYSGVLLILLAYLGMRLSRSYRTIANMNRALARANETLELRVSDRTRELAAALATLKESEAQLVQSAKMSSLGQMVAGVVHEINTPLAYVKNSLGAVAERLPEVASALGDAGRLIDMLEQGSASEEALGQQFARAAVRLSRLRQDQVVEDLGTLARDGLHGIEQLVGLVCNLRNFSRVDRSQASAYDVNQGLESSLALARHLLKTIEVRRELADLPTIRCSPSQVNQIFLNLIVNAAQAITHAKGRITVRSRREGADCVAVEVEDNGSGIAPQILPQIFDPFFTTKEIGKGTGLGLSIAYKIAEQHGGRIEVASTVGSGARFTVVLPIALPTAAELAA